MKHLQPLFPLALLLAACQVTLPAAQPSPPGVRASGAPASAKPGPRLIAGPGDMQLGSFLPVRLLDAADPFDLARPVGTTVRLSATSEESTRPSGAVTWRLAPGAAGGAELTPAKDGSCEVRLLAPGAVRVEAEAGEPARA